MDVCDGDDDDDNEDDDDGGGDDNNHVKPIKKENTLICHCHNLCTKHN